MMENLRRAPTQLPLSNAMFIPQEVREYGGYCNKALFVGEGGIGGC